jgi:hypothetical protein
MMFHRNELNKFRFLQFGLIAMFTLLVGFMACKKEIGQVPSSPDSGLSVQDRTDINDPTVTQGMLNFTTFEQLNGFVKSLKDNEADTARVRSAYTALGVNTYGETMPNLTDHPLCLLKEQTLGGYISARKAQETVINAALDNGDDNIFSIVSDPYWKTVLNADRAVKVGNRIYKFYENDGVAIVLNNDWTLYNAIKTQPWDGLGQVFNLVVTHQASSDFEDYFNLAANGTILSDKSIFKPRFSKVPTSEGKSLITNVSCIASLIGTPSFTWTYADNTTSAGKDPAKSIGQGEAISVVMNDGAGNTQTITESTMFICSVENFAITSLGNNLFKFGPAFDPANSPYYTKWVFNDGTTLNGSTVTKTFTSNGWVRCEAYWQHNNQLACQFTKPVVVKCGDKKTHNENFTFDQSNQRWRLEGSIWVQSGEVGCKVKYLRWRGAILKWQPANNQGSCADLSGTYIREVSNPTKTCIDVTASGSKCLGDGTFPTTVSHTIADVSTIFNKPGQLSAGLGIKVNGTWRGWGYAGKPRLVLP